MYKTIHRRKGASHEFEFNDSVGSTDTISIEDSASVVTGDPVTDRLNKLESDVKVVNAKLDRHQMTTQIELGSHREAIDKDLRSVRDRLAKNEDQHLRVNERTMRREMWGLGCVAAGTFLQVVASLMT